MWYFPLCMLDLKNQTLFVVAPHPDDEILGCGGLIKRIKSAGGKVHVLFMTVGETKEYSNKGGSNGKEREAEIERVAKKMKYDDYKIVFPGDTFHLRLDNVPQKEIISEIEAALNTIKPTIVAGPHPDDYNQDHRACAEAIFAATRPAPDEFKPFQGVVLGYESVTVANWAYSAARIPNFYVALDEKELEAKIDALKLYGTQVRDGAHPRSLQSLRNLAYFRGMHVGRKAAEAFTTYRFLVP